MTGSGITYTTRELLEEVNRKIDSLARDLTALTNQVNTQDKVNAALRERAASNFTRREKIIGILLALAALSIQVFVFFFGGK